MKALPLFLAFCLLCSASVSAADPAVAVGGASDSSLVAAFFGAVTVAAGLMRIRRRR